IASHRQDRPQMPKDWCPFCPGSPNVPEEFDVLKYDNDFPALSQAPPKPDDVETDFFKVKEAYGKCEVILYSSEHTVTLPELSTEHIGKLVDLWIERFHDISKDKKIQYIFIFENRGEVVGVTMPHPHGQIYGYSVIPKKIELELKSAKEYNWKNKKCLFCDTLKAEKDFEKRIVFSNEHFTVFLPFFTEYPYGVYIMPNRHFGKITEMTEEEKQSFAETLKETTGMLDSLFDTHFPYMMCMHNSPVNGENTKEFYHFHVEFFPPMRSADKVKFNASSETGAWAHCNPTAPEDKAEELRTAHRKFLSKMNGEG
ncbi:MAG: galactose-1-phosphate uridylyltransferase, partial [Clostridiales bacterium 43-6]